MKTVVITGADRNLGLELAKQFLQRGWHVFAGRFLMELPFLDELKEQYPESLSIVPLDVSKEEAVEAAAALVAKETDHVDMLIHNAAGFGEHAGKDKKASDFSSFMAPYNINCLGAMRMVHFFLPLMQTGMKRLCFVSSEAGVVSVAHRTQVSSYCMSKTALNMALRLMFNQLQPMGYTFRLYCKDPCASAEKAGEFAAEYFIRNRSNEPESYRHSDENRLVLRDWMGIELPW